MMYQKQTKLHIKSNLIAVSGARLQTLPNYITNGHTFLSSSTSVQVKKIWSRQSWSVTDKSHKKLKSLQKEL